MNDAYVLSRARVCTKTPPGTGEKNLNRPQLTESPIDEQRASYVLGGPLQP